MSDEIKKINVRIGGISYQLVSAEDEKYTRQVAARADEMIRRVMQSNPQLSQNMSAILALVNSLDELARIRQQFGTLDDQRQLHDRQLAEARSELARMREQNWEMKKELLRLNALCHDYDALLERAVVSAPVTEAGRDDKLDDSDDTVYVEDDENAPSEPSETGILDQSADQSDPVQPESMGQLTQTNLDEYLRNNGWPQPIEPRQYDL